jgi:hypothetical protein
MKTAQKAVHFIQHAGTSSVGNFPIPEGFGLYFTKYNPETGEGHGWYGTATEKAYHFERKIIGGTLMQHECGYGRGCFYNEWKDASWGV